MSRPRGSVEPRESPYFGLDYYEEKFGAWFMGRETEDSKIITNLRASRLTLLYAGSGVGKSSLLRAGVAWRMRSLADDSLARRGTARFVPIVFSSWKDDPVLELTGAIRAAIGPYLAGRPRPELPSGRLDAAIAAASDAVNAGLLIMLDQFEEYFLYRTHEPTPERFADEFARCVNRADLRANFLIAIREDAYAGLGDLFKGRIANVYGNYLHIDYLDRASAEKAIREPLDIYNGQPGVGHVTIQDELVAAVLDQVRAIDGDTPQGQPAAVGGDGRVATPLLQLVMQTLWERERAAGSPELRLSTLQELHGVSMIVEAHLDKAVSALAGNERQAAVDVFGHLVTPSGGKIAESVPDLARVTGHSEAQVSSVLGRLDHERIVRPVPAAPGQDPVRYRRYEIFHDVLAPAINRMIAVREERRRARRFRRFTALAAALLIMVLAIAGVFAFLWHRVSVEQSAANSEKLTSESRQLAAEADLHIADDPELSALLALQAWRLRHTSQAEEALRMALPEIQEMRTFTVGTAVHSAAISPADANKVASADRYGIVSIWDVKTGHRLMKLSLGDFNVTGGALTVAFNPAGSEVAAGFAGDRTSGQIALFDARSGRKLTTASLRGIINGIVFLGSTGELAVATGQGVALWNPQSRSSCCQMLSREPAYTVAADPASPGEFATTTASGPVIWTIGNPARPRQFQQPDDSWLAYDAAFSPDGGELVAADSDGKVRIYDTTDPTSVVTLDAGDAVATSVAFSPDGGQIAAGYSSGMTRVWDVSTRLQLAQLVGHDAWVSSVGFSAKGDEVVTASEDGTIRVWYPQPREMRAQFASPDADGMPNPVTRAQYISRNRIVVLDESGNLRVFTPEGTPQAFIGPSSAWMERVAWNTSGTRIVTVEGNKTAETVTVWHATDPGYTQLRRLSAIQASGVRNVAMSPDGSRFALVTDNNYYELQLRDAQSGRLMQTLNAKNSIQTIAFGPSGRQIFAADYNGQVEVWDAATGDRLPLLGKPGPQITDIEFDRSGGEFVTASADGTVTVWTVPGGRPLITFSACPSPNTAAPSPDGRKIVVACGNGTALVFGDSGQQLTALPATISGTVATAGFSPDGKNIITVADSEGTGGVQIWTAELANTSPSVIERIAEQRITRQLTPAERSAYLAGLG